MEFESKIQEGLEGIFDLVIKERKEYHEKTTNLNGISVDTIIKRYSNINGAISGGSSMIPGPIGMLSSVPEIISVVRNQVAMCYDIGVALKKEDKITKELLIGIFVSSVGLFGVRILIEHGSKTIVKRASLRIIQKIVQLLGVKITQKLLKSMISKWIPVAGAVVMGIWAKQETIRIGEYAKKVFSGDIEFSEEDVEENF